MCWSSSLKYGAKIIHIFRDAPATYKQKHKHNKMYFLAMPCKTTIIYISESLFKALCHILLDTLFYTAPETDERQENKDHLLKAVLAAESLPFNKKY